MVHRSLLTAAVALVAFSAVAAEYPARPIRIIVPFTPGSASDLLARITIEDGKLGGKPCIRGMRIRVSDVLQLLSSGATFDEILADFPYLERADIQQALEYAAWLASEEVFSA